MTRARYDQQVLSVSANFKLFTLTELVAARAPYLTISNNIRRNNIAPWLKNVCELRKRYK